MGRVGEGTPFLGGEVTSDEGVGPDCEKWPLNRF